MKPVRQTQRGRTGNCFAACMASLLEMPIHRMPTIFKDRRGALVKRDWLTVWKEFLRPFGLSIVWVNANHHPAPWGWCIADMKQPETTKTHAVLCYDGEIKYDPLPGIGEFTGAANWYVLTVLDPAPILPQSP